MIYVAATGLIVTLALGYFATRYSRKAQPPRQSVKSIDGSSPTTSSNGLSRTTILIAIVPLVLACMTAMISEPSRPSFFRSTPPTVPLIPISLVLKRNLALASNSWEHGVLSHALLELQNPELTVFAGPGYGFDLRKPLGNSGRNRLLEPFPEGKLPKCAAEDRGSSWGRYDQWTKVKGLRYAVSKISTSSEWLIDVSKGGDSDGGSAADVASLGWATLLLERAGATDPVNPVAYGRNAFGEAADRMVKYLVETNVKFAVENDEQDADAAGTISSQQPKDVRSSLRRIGASEGRRWAISHQIGSKQLWADSTFMVPPFLAAYAVARGEEKWLYEAVEQIKAYDRVLSVQNYLDQRHKVVDIENRKDERTLSSHWKHIVSQPRDLGDGVCCHDEGLWLTGNAWALAGIVRVLGVLERWPMYPESGRTAVMHEANSISRRQNASNHLQSIADSLLTGLSSHKLTAEGLLPNYLNVEAGSSDMELNFSDAAGSALVASSVYRLAQLGLLGFGSRTMLSWADKVFEAVANHIDAKGSLGSVTTVKEVPARHSVNETSEGQSFAILMYSARRDCVKLDLCKH